MIPTRNHIGENWVPSQHSDEDSAESTEEQKFADDRRNKWAGEQGADAPSTSFLALRAGRCRGLDLDLGSITAHQFQAETGLSHAIVSAVAPFLRLLAQRVQEAFKALIADHRENFHAGRGELAELALEQSARVSTQPRPTADLKQAKATDTVVASKTPFGPLKKGTAPVSMNWDEIWTKSQAGLQATGLNWP